MSKAKGKPRRVSVSGEDKPRRVSATGEDTRNIYVRYDGQFEIGYRDERGKQRWHGRFANITEARRVRNDLLGRKSRGETIDPTEQADAPSNAPLTYGAAWAAYWADHVADLDENTRGTYGGHYHTHLKVRWEERSLDSFKKSDAAQLIRDLRACGLLEWSIVGIVGVASRVFRYARRDLEWTGTNPFDLLDSRQRPKVSKTPPRRIYEGDELDQVIAATTEPWRTLFRLADLCAGRESELLGLWREEINISDLDAATVDFKYQVSRAGRRKALKTDESLATSYPLPRSAAVMLKAHFDRSSHKRPRDFVFATASGRAISQRNVLRALYRAQERARKPDGLPTFPELFEDQHGNLIVNDRGEFVRNDVPRKALRLPTFHGIRHAAAMDCEDLEETRDMLRHKDATVTAKVYRPHMTAKRRSALRERMEARQRRRVLEADVEAAEHDVAHQSVTRSPEDPASQVA
jgi:integrase